jgi:hypothetical protein
MTLRSDHRDAPKQIPGDGPVFGFELTLKSILALALVACCGWLFVRLWPIVLVLVVALKKDCDLSN